MQNKRNIRILYAIALLQGMVFYGPIATLYREAAGLDIFQIALIESVSLIVGMALELPWGIAADKIGYKRTMIACCMLYFASKLVFWRAVGFFGFLMERILLGVVCAGLSGVDESMLYLSASKEQAQRCFGIYDGLSQLGLLLAALVYSLFVGENYRLAGLLTVFSYGAAALLALGLQEVRHAPEARQGGFGMSLKQIFKNRKLLLLILAAALLSESHQTITVFLAQKKYAALGMSAGLIGGAFIVLSLAGVLGGRLSSALTVRLGRARSGGLLMLAAAAACAVLAFTASPLAAVLAVVALRLACTLFMPLNMQLQNEQVQTQNRATELSVYAFLMSSIAVLTNLAFGKLAEHRLSLAMLLGALMCLAGAICFGFFMRRKGS